MSTHFTSGAGAVLLAATAILAHPQGALAGSAGAELAAPGEPVMLTDTQRAKILRALSLNGGAHAPPGKEPEISEPSKRAPSRAVPTSSTDDAAADADAGLARRRGSGGAAPELRGRQRQSAAGRADDKSRVERDRSLEPVGSAYPGKVDTDIGSTRYRRIKERKSETSDLRGFP
jgi:hypothetical protein